MKSSIIKIGAIILAIVMFLNFLFLIIIPGYSFTFFIISAMIAVIAFKIIPRLQKAK